MTQIDDTTRSGNTISGTRIRNRAWFITSFEELEPNHFDKASYECWCLDTTKPEKGSKIHLHHLIYFKNAISFNTIKKIYPKAHIEKPHNVNDCIGYILNNINGRKYDIHELGTKPIDSRFSSVKDLKELANPEELDWKQYKTWLSIHNEDEIDLEDFRKEVKVYYIEGPSGIGKTELAKKIIRDSGYKKLSLAKYENNFWNGVGSNRDVCLYDDFRDSHMKASEFVNFIDYNKHRMNIKGSSCMNDYKLIIITSVQSLDDIYRNCIGEPRKQWERRVERIVLKNNNDEIPVEALI